MIRKASELNSNNKRRVLLYGVPGIAKSTTALSAPNPLMIDTDRGWERIPAQFRKCDYIQPETYAELLSDLNQENCRSYESIIFDTGGTLLNLMKDWAIKKDPKDGQKDGQTLSMRGYGTVGREFQRLMDYCFYTLNKNIIIIFHAKEEMDGEYKVFRIDVEGRTKGEIWKPMDIGGFMEAHGERRVIGFSPTERYFAKGTMGISGIHEIPNVMKPGVPNDFLSNLFAYINQTLNSEIEMVKKYDELMNTVRATIEEVTNSMTATQALDAIKSNTQYFGSLQESKHLLNEKVNALGLKYDREKGLFV